MKKYNLSAEFIRWKGTDEDSGKPDSFVYIIELASDEEARVRLDSLIIERMASKPGWNYQLVRSGFSEFLSSDTLDHAVEDQADSSETISLSDQAIFTEESQSSIDQKSIPDPSDLPESILSKDEGNPVDTSLKGNLDAPPELN